MPKKEIFLDEKALAEMQKIFAETGIDPGELNDEPRVMPPGAAPVVQRDRVVSAEERKINSTPLSNPTIWS